jgi:hypothetical protein
MTCGGRSQVAASACLTRQSRGVSSVLACWVERYAASEKNAQLSWCTQQQHRPEHLLSIRWEGLRGDVDGPYLCFRAAEACWLTDNMTMVLRGVVARETLTSDTWRVDEVVLLWAGLGLCACGLNFWDSVRFGGMTQD